MMTYNTTTKNVEVAEVSLGSLDDPEVRKLLRRAISAGIEFDRSLTLAIHWAETRYDRCPNCKSKYHRWNADINGVQIGFCLDCFAALHKADGKIYRTSDGATGVKVWHNRLSENN